MPKYKQKSTRKSSRFNQIWHADDETEFRQEHQHEDEANEHNDVPEKGKKRQKVTSKEFEPTKKFEECIETEDEASEHSVMLEKEMIAVENMLNLMVSGKGLITSQEHEENKKESEDPEMLSMQECSRSIDIHGFNLHPLVDEIEYFPANYTVRSSWSKFKNVIKRYLEDGEEEGNAGVQSAVRKTCFGHFLDLSEDWSFNGMLCHYLLLHFVESRKDREMWFILGNKPLRFGMKEFAIVTRLNCGPFPSAADREKVKKKNKNYLEHILGKKRKSLVGVDLEEMLKEKRYNRDDRINICLVYFLHSILMARDASKKVELDWFLFVKDKRFFNAYPWGRLSFRTTIRSLQTRKFKQAYNQWRSSGKSAKFNLYGFPWAFMVWAYEAISVFHNAGIRLSPSNGDALPIPRILQWHPKRSAQWDYDMIESMLKDNEVVVHPFLIPTKREMQEEYMRSFQEPEDNPDVNIDRLTKELDGVTQLTMHIDQFADLKKEKAQSEDMGDENTPPPLHSPVRINTPQPLHSPVRSSTPQPRHSHVDDCNTMECVKGLEKKMTEWFKDLEKKFDGLKGIVEKLEKRIGLVENIVDKRPEREKKRSHFLTSPYTADGMLKKVRVAEKEGEQPEDIFRPAEDRKRAFYDWYEKNDKLTRGNGFVGQYKRDFYSAFLAKGFWLDDAHIHEGLNLVRFKQRNTPHLYDQACAVLDAYFGQYLLKQGERISEWQNGDKEGDNKEQPKKEKRKRGTLHDGKPRYGKKIDMDEVEKILYDNGYNTVFNEYFEGKRPHDGRNWCEVNKIYCVLNVFDKHWLTVVWMLDEGRIEILDCNTKAYKQHELEEVMWGPCVVLPKILKLSGKFSHLKEEIFNRPWSYRYVPNLPTNLEGGDCGPYALSFVEFHMTNSPMDELNDVAIQGLRERFAIELFLGEYHCDEN